MIEQHVMDLKENEEDLEGEKRREKSWNFIFLKSRK